eukprot:g13754.t1
MCFCMCLAFVLALTALTGINNEAIQIKGELFQMIEARGDGSPNFKKLAFEPQLYEEVQGQFTKIINKLETEQINSTIKGGSLFLVSATLGYRTQGSKCWEPTSDGLPHLYSNFRYVKKKDCGGVRLETFIFRTNGLRNESKKECARYAFGLRNKCRNNAECNFKPNPLADEVLSASCDSIGDWNGTLNGTSINTASEKLKYLMEPENKIAYGSKNLRLYLEFYHPNTGYFFFMQLRYDSRDGHYSIDEGNGEGFGAPLNPFFGSLENAQSTFTYMTLIFICLEICKSSLIVLTYIRRKIKCGNSIHFKHSDADCVFAILSLGACICTIIYCLIQSYSTTLGIALGSVDRETVLGNMFGLHSWLAETFYWVVFIVMFLMLNLLLAIILDAFEKNQDDRRSIDKPLIELFVSQPINYIMKKALFCSSCCKNKSNENDAVKTKTNVGDIGLSAYLVADTWKTAMISKRILDSKATESLFQDERQKSIDEGILNENPQTILSKIRFDQNSMKENLGTILDNPDEIEKHTNLLFKAYGKDEKERMALENQLREIQSHVTKSLGKTDMKIKRTEQQLDLILRHLKIKVG